MIERKCSKKIVKRYKETMMKMDISGVDSFVDHFNNTIHEFTPVPAGFKPDLDFQKPDSDIDSSDDQSLENKDEDSLNEDMSSDDKSEEAHNVSSSD
jgi:hypothetical protein